MRFRRSLTNDVDEFMDDGKDDVGYMDARRDCGGEACICLVISEPPSGSSILIVRP